MKKNQPSEKTPVSKAQNNIVPVKKGKRATKAKDNETVLPVNGQKTKKQLSKRSMIAIIISAVIVVLLAIALPIGIIFGSRRVTTPTVSYVFNDETDYYITFKWDKVRKATAYEYQYVYGEPSAENANVIEGKTTNTTTRVKRHKKGVSFRVKSIISGENTEYSDWLQVNVSAWKLEEPIVTITDTLQMSWAASTYKIDDVVKNVERYEYTILIDGNELPLPAFSEFTYLDGAIRFLMNWIWYSDKISKYEPDRKTEDWEDIEIELKVRAVTYSTLGDAIDTETEIEEIYDPSEYNSVKFTITEDIYKKLIEMYKDLLK